MSLVKSSKSQDEDIYAWQSLDINVDFLRYFLAAVELGSFQAAAEYLHVTPQAVGKSIARLEEQLGTLIIRDKRLRGLTSRGRALAAESTKIIQALSELTTLVAPQKSSKATGPVAIGATASIAQYILPVVCAKVRRKYPKIQPHLLALSPPEVEEGVLSGQLDFGVTALAPTKDGVQAQAGPETPSVIVAAEGEPGDWRDFQYIIPRLPVGTRQSLDGWPSRGFPRDIIAETNQLEVALRLAEAGVGATVVPLVAVQDRLESGSLKVVASPPVDINHRLWTHWRAGAKRSRAALVLAAALDEWQLPSKGFVV